jgi:protein-disulfide isomerase
VRSFYEEHAEEAGGRPYEEFEGALREELSRRQRGAAWESFVAGLHEAHPSQVRLEPPRMPVEATGPARGPESAPVTIVTFSDYNCPYCKQSNAVMDEVLTRYPEQVRLVLRHYPLDSLHPRARAAAEAAACAHEQGRFWDYHERLFQIFMAMPGDALTSLAGELGLDRTAFESCVVERRTQTLVERDVEAGQRAGVRGTPAFFVNGIRLTGSQSVEALQRVIDEELERQAAKTS